MSKAALINSYVGSYRLTDFLGEGGMGEVYRAVHSRLERVVAIKLLNSSLPDASFIERFHNEARIQANLQHPNIVTLYDFLEHNGKPCIVMEYIEGATLTQCIRECRALPLKEAMRIFQLVVEAIEYIHNQNVIHRDIKSNNIKITPRGQVKVLDFGIAKSGSSPSLTRTGNFVGTLQYLSPEQFNGDRASAQSDIWSLGVLLYEMTTGHMPFEADTVGSLLAKINKCDYVQPSILNDDIPHEVQSLIAACLKKNPSDRYSSASELLHAAKQCAFNIDIGKIGRPHRLSLISTIIQRRIKRKRKAPALIPPNKIVSVEPKRRWPLLAASAAIILMMFAGLYFLLLGPSLETGGTTIKVYTMGTRGEAEVYKGNSKIGITPYTFTAHPNEVIELVLKQNGYEDYVAKITVGEKYKEYGYAMTEKKDARQ
ncbi:MAG TPA: serine/threonine-protein kinase [Blastocatellia bacterium]|nr:serine/threonine-protein kinase [Blastocatellia bacterium]